MALTPEDVRNKLFTTVRLREGYEQTEVDEFLDEVEAELTRLRQENEELRARATAGSPSSVTLDKPTPAPAPAPTPTLTPARPSPPEIVVRTSGDVSAAAARVLEMAQRTAEQYVDEARAEADKLVTDARTSAESMSSEARVTAEKLTADARAKADEVDRETHQRTTALERDLAEQRKSALDALQLEKRRLESEVETLRSFEREYRGRLRSFLENQLEQLSVRSGGDTPLAPAGGPVTSRGEAATETTQDVLASDTDEAALEGAPAQTSQATTPAAGGPASVASGSIEAGDGGQGRRVRTGGPLGAESDSAEGGGNRSPGARSALGRILEEEERKADGSA